MNPGADRTASASATRLGSYEIVRALARGGMAELFLARAVGPQGFEKLVVLKRILPSFAANPRFVQLFLDEAKLGASLDHPHIAQVHDMGMVDDAYFFTMEYLHGQDVRSILRRAFHVQMPLPIDHAVQIVRNIAAALHYAHERRGADGKLREIVHRDVSPSNIIVSYDGAVKLLDFGVAKASSSTVKTRTGTLKGKVAYMSPEQARGASIDRRSDIFSLGIVLWEMVATRRLFKAANDLATIQMIIHEPTARLLDARPDCPAELERIVSRALAKRPEDRYQTSEELQVELEELARESKLNQSSIGLSKFMATLFRDEMDAWKTAQSRGVTLTDHVASSVDDPPSHGDLTTPVSGAMLEFGPDPDENQAEEPDSEVDDGAFGPPVSNVSGAIVPQEIPITPLPPILLPAMPTEKLRMPEIHDDVTQQMPPPAMKPARAATPPPALRPAKTRAATPPPPPTSSISAVQDSAIVPTPVAPIPIAPASAWSAAEVTDQLAGRSRARRWWLIAITVLLVVGAVVFVLNMGPKRNAADDVKAKPSELEAKTVKADPPKPDPATADPAKADPTTDDTKPDRPKADDTIAKPEPAKSEPAIAKPEPAIAKPTPKPAITKPVTIAKPIAKTEPKPIAKPVAKPKPVVKPADPKPTPKPVAKPKPFDPDAPLPPS